MVVVYLIFAGLIIGTVIVCSFHNEILSYACKQIGGIIRFIESILDSTKSKGANYCYKCQYFDQTRGCVHRDVAVTRMEISNEYGEHLKTTYRRPCGIYHIWNRWYRCSRFERRC